MYWYEYMCKNIFQTIRSQFLKIPKLCSLSPGAGSGLKITRAGAAPKQAGSETLSTTTRNHCLSSQVLYHNPKPPSLQSGALPQTETTVSAVGCSSTTRKHLLCSQALYHNPKPPSLQSGALPQPETTFFTLDPPLAW